MPTRVLFYVSGHGFGHARRVAQVIRAMEAMDPSLQVLVRTTAPSGIFAGFTRTAVYPPDEPIDFGAAEQDALSIDVPETLRQVADLLRRRSHLVERELVFLRANPIDLIVADIPYLAGEVAQAAGVPCLAIGNFTWDWIYQPYVANSPAYAPLVAQIRSMYAKMIGVLRLPFAHSMDGFRQVTDVPLVVNHPQYDRETILRRLGIPTSDSRPKILIGMRGGVSSESLRSAIESTRDFLFLSFQDYPGPAPEQFRRVRLDATLDFTDVLSVCDAIVSKLGYGTVAEAIVCRTAILWPRRSGFCEEEIMESQCPHYLRMKPLLLDDYRTGRWTGPLRSLLEQPMPSGTLQTDGAAACANAILNAATR
ncbi:MAG: hypothetical protein ACM359_10820 [Bacillota bacterium]